MFKPYLIVVGVVLTAASAAAQTKPSGVITPPAVVSPNTVISEPLSIRVEGFGLTALEVLNSGGGPGATGLRAQGPFMGGEFGSLLGAGVYAGGAHTGLQSWCAWQECNGVNAEAGGDGGTGVLGRGRFGVIGEAKPSTFGPSFAGLFRGNVRVEGTLDAPIIQQLQAQIANLTARLAALEPLPCVGCNDPIRIEAENYDAGGQGVGYSDRTPGNDGGAYRSDDVDIKVSREGGHSVGWFAAGEWLAYTVDLPVSGAYTMTFRVGSAFAGRTFRVDVFGADIGPLAHRLEVPQFQDWDRYGTVSLPIGLGGGRMTFRITMGPEDYMDFQWLEIARR